MLDTNGIYAVLRLSEYFFSSGRHPMRTLQTSVDSSPAMETRHRSTISPGNRSTLPTSEGSGARCWRPTAGSRPARAYARRHEMLQDIRELQKLLGLGYPTIEPGEPSCPEQAVIVAAAPGVVPGGHHPSRLRPGTISHQPHPMNGT